MPPKKKITRAAQAALATSSAPAMIDRAKRRTAAARAQRAAAAPPVAPLPPRRSGPEDLCERDYDADGMPVEVALTPGTRAAIIKENRNLRQVYTDYIGTLLPALDEAIQENQANIEVQRLDKEFPDQYISDKFRGQGTWFPKPSASQVDNFYNAVSDVTPNNLVRTADLSRQLPYPEFSIAKIVNKYRQWVCDPWNAAQNTRFKVTADNQAACLAGLQGIIEEIVALSTEVRFATEKVKWWILAASAACRLETHRCRSAETCRCFSAACAACPETCRCFSAACAACAETCCRVLRP